MKLTLLSVVAFVCVAATCASADTITFTFSSTPGTTTTANYTGSDGVTMITATATGTGSPDLFFKNHGGNETGLGLTCTTCDSDREINPGQSIMFDLSSLFSHHITSLTLTLGSIQAGETGQVCDSNKMCITFNSSENGKAVDITSLYDDMLKSSSGTLTITAPSGDVLINELVATSSVPEPSSVLFLGTGVFMMAGAIRKRLGI